MSITFAACKLDGDTFRPRTDGPNLSNRNAFIVLRALFGTDPEPCDSMPIGAFAAACQQWLRRHLGSRSDELSTTVEHGDGGATMIDCGLPEGYINDRIHQLSMLASAARANDATHITWS